MKNGSWIVAGDEVGDEQPHCGWPMIEMLLRQFDEADNPENQDRAEAAMYANADLQTAVIVAISLTQLRLRG